MTPDQCIRWIAKPLLFALCLGPLGWLAWEIFAGGLAPAGGLGANPIEAINRFLGDWGLRFLLITLAMTPLSGVIGSPTPIRFRRMLGLFAFAYVTLHISSYTGLDQRFDWGDIWGDIVKRNYITVGMATFLMLVPLAATSTKGMVRRLGASRWLKLHRLVYVAGITGVFHYTMMIKADIREPMAYAAILAVLLGYRVVKRKKRRRRRAKSPAG
jgi:sulfoxide reductase heme-binding subunit YedZ